MIQKKQFCPQQNSRYIYNVIRGTITHTHTHTKIKHTIKILQMHVDGRYCKHGNCNKITLFLFPFCSGQPFCPLDCERSLSVLLVSLVCLLFVCPSSCFILRMLFVFFLQRMSDEILTWEPMALRKVPVTQAKFCHNRVLFRSVSIYLSIYINCVNLNMSF